MNVRLPETDDGLTTGESFAQLLKLKVNEFKTSQLLIVVTMATRKRVGEKQTKANIQKLSSGTKRGPFY